MEYIQVSHSRNTVRVDKRLSTHGIEIRFTNPQKIKSKK